MDAKFLKKKKNSPQKLFSGFLPNFKGMFLRQRLLTSLLCNRKFRPVERYRHSSTSSLLVWLTLSQRQILILDPSKLKEFADLSQRQILILDPSRLKEFADNIFKFDENGKKFLKRVESTVGKGEIACYKKFCFSHSVFKRLALQTCENQDLFRKGLKVKLT